jgi:CubicO group peptidase (beta-lactamase class C family)
MPLLRCLPCLLVFFVIGLILQFGAPLAAAPLPRATPESTGVSSAAIESFLGHLESAVDSPHSFMLVRQGKVIAEGWWAPHASDAQHVFFSLSKSFTSTAVGLAIAAGRLNLNDRVIDHFPLESPPHPSQNLSGLRIRDLLAMNTGHHQEDLAKFSWVPADPNQTLVESFLQLPVAHKPGTHFLYNTPATYMLSAIVQKVTGQGLVDYLNPRLFIPLDIQRPHWDESRDGIALGGFGMRATTEDIAKFGQLYLQKGEWNGRRLIPASYVAAATSKQTSNGSNPDSDWDQGYGYQFWLNKTSGFRGDGLFGQFCIVLPEYDTVVAMTSGTLDMGGVMNQIWQHLLPALGPLPYPENQSAAQALADRLTGLQMVRPRGVKHSSVSETKPNQVFTFPTNKVGFDTVALSFGSDEATLTVEQDGHEHILSIGYHQWNLFETGAFNLIDGIPMPNPVQRAGASGAWSNDTTFLARICLPETPYVFDLQFVFNDDGTVTFSPRLNVNRSAPYPTVIGQATKP